MSGLFDDILQPAKTKRSGGLFDDVFLQEEEDRKKPDRTWGQVASDTVLQLGEGANTLVGAIPSLIAPESEAADMFRRGAQFYRDQQSEPLKQRIASADKAISAAGEDGMIAQISEAASQYFSDPGLAARFVTTNLPSLIPGVGVAKVAQAAALARGATALRAASVATTAAGATSATLNAGGARGEAFEDIKRTLIKQGVPADEAEEQALSDSRVAAAVGGIAGFVSGKTGLERALVGRAGGAGAVRAFTGGLVKEAAGEQLEEVAPKLTTNLLASQYDGRDISKDVGRTMVETAIGASPGSILSGGMDAFSRQRQPDQLPPPPPPPPPSAQADLDAAAADLRSAVDPYVGIKQATTVDAAIDAAARAAAAPVPDPILATPAPIPAPTLSQGVAAAESRGLVQQQLDIQRQLDEAAGLPTTARVPGITPPQALAQMQGAALPIGQPEQDIIANFEAKRAAAVAAIDQALGVAGTPRAESTPAELEAKRKRATQAALGEMGDTLPRFRYTPELQGNKQAQADGAAEPDLAGAYVQQMRETNTPAARAFVQMFEAGTVTPTDVVAMLDRQSPKSRVAPAPTIPSNATPLQTEGLQIEQQRRRAAPTLDLKDPAAAVAERARQASGQPDISPDLAQQRLEAAAAQEPVAPTQAGQYIAALRLENTPQARALVGEYEAGRVGDQDIADAVNMQRRYLMGGAEPSQARIDAAAAQAPGPAEGLQIPRTGTRPTNPALAEAVALYGDRPLTAQDLTVEGASARLERAAQGAPQPAAAGGIEVASDLEPRGAFLGRNEAIRAGNNLPRPVRVGGVLAESLSDAQLQTTAANSALPAITRRGAQIEIMARQQELRGEQAAPATADATARLEAAAAQGRALAQPTAGRIITSSAKLSTPRAQTPGTQHTLQDQGTDHNYTVVEPGKLGGQGKMLAQVSRIFGKKLVVFESETLQADGFVQNDDDSSIYINAKSSVSPLAVFGHELTHLIKRDNADAYSALQSVVQRNLAPEGMAKFEQEYGTGANLEELTSDLTGNRFQEPQFWSDVFTEIAAANPEQSRSIITRLAGALNKAVNAFVKAVRQPGFKADQYVKDLDAVKAAVKQAVSTYAKQQREPAMRMEAELMRAESQTNLAAGSSAPAKVSQADAAGITASPARNPQVDTPAFKQFYADSKVVDPQGRPVQLYRGMRGQAIPDEGADEFSPQSGLYGTGVYLSSGTRRADGYADGPKGQVYPVYAAVKNPIDSEEFIERFGRSRRSPAESQRITDQLIGEGYDGVVERGGPGGFVEVVAFRGEQVKSSIGNDGSFDSSSRKITRSPVRKAVPEETEISTQNPQAVNRKYDPIEDMLSIDEAAVREAMALPTKPGKTPLSESITNAILGYGFVPTNTPRDEVISVYKQSIVSNLMYLFNQVPKRIRDRSKLWYDGANRIATDMGKAYGVKMEQVAGIMAAMSPQKDWFQNVSMAERALDILTGQGQTAWDDNMLAYAKSYVEETRDRKEREKRQKAYDRAAEVAKAGTVLNDMDPDDAAVFIRSYDEAYHSRQYRIVTPEGGFGDLVRNADGKPSTMMWSTYDPIVKSVSIFRNGSRKNISEQLGEEHKIRSFYNNISAPNSPISHVTIDTHAVAAGHFEALAGTDKEVTDNFGGTGGSSLLGVGGTYGIVADAYRDAARMAGVSAREMQSITWEAVRGLFGENIKSSIKPKVRAIWSQFRDGKLSFASARRAIVRLAEGYNKTKGGILDPDWVGSGEGQAVADGGASYDKSFVPEGGVRLRESKEIREKVSINLSAATSSIPGLKELYARALGGEAEAGKLLQDVAESSLRFLLGGTKARLVVEASTGVYMSDREPSIGLQVAFDESETKPVLAALAAFADSFNQQQIHVRVPTVQPVGHEFGDGSYATPVYEIDLQRELSADDISAIIADSGLKGFTVTPKTLTAYWVKPTDKAQHADDFNTFGTRIARVQELAGQGGSRPRRKIERLYAYGEGDGARVPYSSIRGDVRTKSDADEKTPRLIAEYLNKGPVRTFAQKPLTAAQVKEQKQLAEIFEALPSNDLERPLVQRAYTALTTALKEQFQVLPIKVEVMASVEIDGKSYPYWGPKSQTLVGKLVDDGMTADQARRAVQYLQRNYGTPPKTWKSGPLAKVKAVDGEPYRNSGEMRRDVSLNNRSRVYKTSPDTFGPPGADFSAHPLLQDSGFKDVNGYPMLFNDVLRAVHDYFAHNLSATQFGPNGEAAAWRNHMASTPDPMARWALTAETRLQNAWQNFRPGVENLSTAERGFSEQKAALPPAQYSLTGDAEIDAPMKEFIDGLAADERRGSLPADVNIKGAKLSRTRERKAADISVAELRGRKVAMQVRVEDTGETGTLTMDAADSLTDIEERESAMQRLLECLRK